MTQAQDSVSTELQRLDAAMERCLHAVDAEFADIISKIEKRRVELQAAVSAAVRDKKRVLEEQHAAIEVEKNKVERECEGLQYQVCTYMNFFYIECIYKKYLLFIIC